MKRPGLVEHLIYYWGSRQLWMTIGIYIVHSVLEKIRITLYPLPIGNAAPSIKQRCTKLGLLKNRSLKTSPLSNSTRIPWNTQSKPHITIINRVPLGNFYYICGHSVTCLISMLTFELDIVDKIKRIEHQRWDSSPYWGCTVPAQPPQIQQETRDYWLVKTARSATACPVTWVRFQWWDKAKWIWHFHTNKWSTFLHNLRERYFKDSSLCLLWFVMIDCEFD